MTTYEPSEIVIAGDLLHSFDRIPTGAVRTGRAIERVTDAGAVRPIVCDPVTEEVHELPPLCELRRFL